MGMRLLEATPDMLVEFLKMHGGGRRSYEVQNAFPPDARVVAVGIDAAENKLQIWLESIEWPDKSPTEPLEQPIITIHYEDEQA